MKIVEGFTKTKILDKTVIIPVGSKKLDFSGIITLNDTASFLWDLLLNETEKNELLQALMNEYDVSEENALKDIEAFLNELKNNNLLNI